MIYILSAWGKTTSLGNLRQKLNVYEGRNINQNVHVAYLERYKRPLSVIISNLEILKYLVYFDARLLMQAFIGLIISCQNNIDLLKVCLSKSWTTNQTIKNLFHLKYKYIFGKQLMLSEYILFGFGTAMR
jgi:hypothetical protein